MEKMKSEQKRNTQQSQPELALIAMIATSHVGEAYRSAAIWELLGAAEHYAELVVFNGNDWTLMSKLQKMEVKLIVIVDCIIDLEETCRLRNCLKVSHKLQKIQVKTLTSFLSRSNDEDPEDISPADEELLEVIPSKRN